MLIGQAEGQNFSFEIIESIDGFTVRCCDLGSGEVHEGAETLFRTAAAAFAYAELAASLDRIAEGVEHEDDLQTHRACEARFARLLQDLRDQGVSGALLGAWTEVEERARRRQVH